MTKILPIIRTPVEDLTPLSSYNKIMQDRPQMKRNSREGKSFLLAGRIDAEKHSLT